MASWREYVVVVLVSQSVSVCSLLSRWAKTAGRRLLLLLPRFFSHGSLWHLRGSVYSCFLAGVPLACSCVGGGRGVIVAAHRTA